MSQQTFYSQSQSNRNPNQRHPTCPRCGSRKWRRDPNRGAVVCAEGHVLEGFLRESNEQTEPSQYSIRRRRLKAGPKEKKQYVLKSTYQGKQARILLLQSLTLLIRKQFEALIQIIKAPAQLEEIGRSLWRSYLSALDLDDMFVQTRSASPAAAGSQVEDDPEVDMLSEDSESAHSKGPSRSTRSRSRKNKLDDPESLKDIAHDQSSDDSLPSSPSSSSSSSDEALQDDSTRHKYRKQVENIRVHPRMEVTICTIYLACMKLRIPIILQDIINFIVTKQLPYLGFLYTVPPEIKQKMNRSVMETFWVEKPPRLFYRQDDNNGLFSVCHQLIKIFHESNPPVLSPEDTVPNLTLLISRFSKVLLLPEPLQLLCMHLLQKLDSNCIDYNPPKRTSGSTSTASSGRPANINGRPVIGRRQVAKYPPEWFTMAVVYIVAHSAILNYSKGEQSDRSSDADQNDDLDEMLSLIIGQLPKPSKWYADLKQEIECDNDKNPQKLWELSAVKKRKNIIELDLREIDLYIELAKDFLLKDEPEANNIAFKDQYFPLSSNSSGVDGERLEDNQSTIEEDRGIIEEAQRRIEEAQRTIQEDQSGVERRVDTADDLYDPILTLYSKQNPVNHNNRSRRKEQVNENDKQERHVDLLKNLLLNRASEFVGCTSVNHSNLNEFLKVLSFVNSMLSKQLLN